MNLPADIELIQEIRSRRIYWNEVAERENGDEILRREFAELYRVHGLVLLRIILDWAEMTYNNVKPKGKKENDTQLTRHTNSPIHNTPVPTLVYAQACEPPLGSPLRPA